MAPERESRVLVHGEPQQNSGRILCANYVLLKQLQIPKELTNIVSHVPSMTNGSLWQLTLACRAPLTTPQVSHPYTPPEA